MPIKLNLGSGRKHFDPADGWINVDLPGNMYGVKADVEADIRKLPFEDEYADEVHAIHVLEHFYIWEAPNVLSEWNRVLKAEGKIFIELPDMQKIVKNLVAGMGCQRTWAGLYGDPTVEHPEMVHKWCYTFQMLKEMLEFVGFGDVVREEPCFHIKARDMRIVATKKTYDKSSICFSKQPSKGAWDAAA